MIPSRHAWAAAAFVLCLARRRSRLGRPGDRAGPRARHVRRQTRGRRADHLLPLRRRVRRCQDQERGVQAQASPRGDLERGHRVRGGAREVPRRRDQRPPCPGQREGGEPVRFRAARSRPISALRHSRDGRTMQRSSYNCRRDSVGHGMARSILLGLGIVLVGAAARGHRRTPQPWCGKCASVKRGSTGSRASGSGPSGNGCGRRRGSSMAVASSSGEIQGAAGRRIPTFEPTARMSSSRLMTEGGSGYG